MQQVQAHDPQAGRVAPDIDRHAIPQVPPRQYVTVEDLGERAGARQSARSGLGGLGDGRITAGEDGDHLFQARATARCQTHRDVVPDPAYGSDRSVVGIERCSVVPQRVTCCDRDRDAGLVGLRAQQDRIVGQVGRGGCLEVDTVEVPVPLDEGVGDGPVEFGADLAPTRPVLRTSAWRFHGSTTRRGPMSMAPSQFGMFTIDSLVTTRPSTSSARRLKMPAA